MSKFNDNIKDWYKIAQVNGTGVERTKDKNYKKHLIDPCMMISIIGSTGAGKSKIICEFLSRKNDVFYEIVIFSGSTVEEPLYDFLKKKIPEIQLIDNVSLLPELDLKTIDKKQEKLIVFDDIINLSSKDLKKIQVWYNSARKGGYTAIVMAQNFSNLPVQIRRNTMIFFIFRLNDTTTITHLLKTHNSDNIPMNILKDMYIDATSKKGDFFKIDFINNTYSHNFTDILKPEDYK